MNQDLEQQTAMLLADAMSGNSEALGQLFCLYEPRLRMMVLLRLDRRVQGRLDMDDVLQEIYLEYARALNSYEAYRGMPFRLWLRMIAGRKLQAIHRHHLGVDARDAVRDVSLHVEPLPGTSSGLLAIQLLGRHTTPSQAAQRAELQLRLQTALNEMDEIDREVLALRHFEELGNSEVAKVLGVSQAAASNRYVRALQRIKELLAEPCSNGLHGPRTP